MSDAFYVWCQLYFRGEGDPGAQPIKIKDLQGDTDISDLKERIYAKKDKKLGHCNADDLLVYRPGTDLMANPDSCIRPDKPLSELLDELKDQTPPTSAQHPLMVVAEAPPQQRQNIRARAPHEDVDNGKKCSRFSGSFTAGKIQIVLRKQFIYDSLFRPTIHLPAFMRQ